MMNNSYLMHHGIDGQKWGVQNGPPYPLNPSARSSSEKKAATSKNIKKTVKKATKTVKKGLDKAGKAAGEAATNLKNAAESASNKIAENSEESKKALKESIKKNGTLKDYYDHKELFTTNELNDAINRVTTEKRLSDMVNPPTAKKTTAGDILKDSLAKAGKETLDSITKYAVKSATKAIVSQMLGEQTSKEMFGGNGKSNNSGNKGSSEA